MRSMRLLRPSLIAALFFFSIPLLGTEVLLLRASLVAFGSDFQYLVIPIAFFGMGIGAAISLAMPRDGWQHALASAATLFAIFLIGIFGSMVFLRGSSAMLMSFVGTIAAYAAAGSIASLSFRMQHDRTAALYAADLIGAAIGALLAPALLNSLAWGAPLAMIAAAFLAAACFALYASRKTAALLQTIVAALFLCGAALHPLTISCSNHAEQFAMDSAYAHLSIAGPADSSGQSNRFVTMWYDCGVTVSAIVTADHWSDLTMLRGDIQAIPLAYAASQKRLTDVLVSAAGGGTDVLRAKLFGAAHITAVEINPDVLRMTDRFAGADTNPFRQENVRVAVTDSRHLLLQESSTYDVEIALRSGLFGSISGSVDTPVYNLTVESTAELIRRLKPDGILVLGRLEPPDAAPRSGVHIIRSYNDPVPIALAALRAEGIDPHEKIALVQNDAERLSLIVVKRDGWSALDRSNLSSIAAQMGHPSVSFVAPESYAELPAALTDDRPFPTEIVGRDALIIYILMAILFLSLLAAIGLRLIAYPRTGKPRWPHGVYFALIGMGFMLFELSALVRTELILAQPDYSAAFVLACILVSAGIASALTGSIPKRSARRALMIALLGLLCASICLAAMPLAWTEWLLSLDLPLRALAIGVPLLIGGFASGIYLPLGVRALEEEHETRLISWAWGIDASFAVVAGFLIKILFHTGGISTALWAAAALYALATAVALLNAPKES